MTEPGPPRKGPRDAARYIEQAISRQVSYSLTPEDRTRILNTIIEAKGQFDDASDRTEEDFDQFVNELTRRLVASLPTNPEPEIRRATGGLYVDLPPDALDFAFRGICPLWPIC